MKQSEKSSLLVVQDDKTAMLLCNPSNQRLLEVFLEPCSIGAAAMRLGQELQPTYSQVQRLVTAGLLHVATVQARKGRAIKNYQLVAADIFVPFEQVGFEALWNTYNAQLEQTFFRQVFKHWFSLATTNQRWGFVLTRNQQQKLQTNAPVYLQPDSSLHIPDEPQVLARWWHWNLSVQDKTELYNDLRGIQQKYAAKSASGDPTVMVHLAMTPIRV